jgi:hypothetical protein
MVGITDLKIGRSNYTYIWLKKKKDFKPR